MGIYVAFIIMYPLSGVVSGECRSRLHLLDLGSCESDVTRTRDGGGGQCLSLAALGNVILALANGAKHVPYRYVHVKGGKYPIYCKS